MHRDEYGGIEKGKSVIQLYTLSYSLIQNREKGSPDYRLALASTCFLMLSGNVDRLMEIRAASGSFSIH